MSDGTVTASVTIQADNRKAVIKAKNEAVERGLQAIGMEAVTLTFRDVNNRGTPVKTGRLRNSITWATQDGSGGGAGGEGGESDPMAEPEKETLVIGSNVEYAQIIEEGTSKRKARHMLRNALTDISDRAEKIMKASLEAAGGGDT